MTSVERSKEWQRKNSKRRSEYAKKYRELHREEEKKQHKIWCEANPDKVKAYDKKRYEKHKEERKERSRRYQRENSGKAADAKRYRNYGMTAEEFKNKRLKQNNRCAICLSAFVKTPFVDHDHITGKNRDLLCLQCNTLLGYAHEDLVVLERTIQYLRKHGVEDGGRKEVAPCGTRLYSNCH